MGFGNRNKDRLHVALFDRGDANKSFHWGLWSAPKRHTGWQYGTLYHATDGPPRRGEWRYETCTTGTGVTGKAIARVLVGKVQDTVRLAATLGTVPLPDPPNSRLWVAAALGALAATPGVLGTCDLDWPHIERCCVDFARDVFASGTMSEYWVATWSLLEDRQLVPEDK